MTINIEIPRRRPRYRRAAAAPPFRLTDGDMEIIHHLARHRFLRSTHVAALVGRSLDRANDRLCRLFHAGYIDRPRAQLDYYPTAGSAPMVYALADRGAEILAEHDGDTVTRRERSRSNGKAGRPFINHQLEIVDFYVALETAARYRDDVRLVPPEEVIAGFPEQTRKVRNPTALRAAISHDGSQHMITVVPDLVFGLMFPDGSRRCFMVEIDRGTMPISRTDMRQTSFLRKMRGYLGAHAAGQHKERFGWKTFRVLTVTTDARRMRSIMQAARRLDTPHSPGPSLFLFATREDLNSADPIECPWLDGRGREVRLL